MADRALVFPPNEYQHRCNRLQDEMQRKNIDALLLAMPADIFYVTGFLTRFWESPARPWFVIVPKSGPPVAVIPSIGADLMRRTWIEDIRTWQAPDPRDDGLSLLADTLADAVGGEGRIGLPMGAETHLRMPLAQFEDLRTRITLLEFVDATKVLHRVREVKSHREIEKIRHICAIAGRAFDRVPQMVAPGMPLSEVFRAFQMSLLDEGADWVSYLAGAAGPGGYGDVISPADDTPLRAGDVLMLDTGAVCDGYFCDFDRNYAVGAVDRDTHKTHQALWEATEHALERLHPGMRASDVHALLSEALLARGVTPCAGRLGHGLGVSLTEWPSFTPLDDTPLRAGMVLTLEPSAEVRPGHILVHEENIVLRNDGAELLSPRAPAELPVLR